MICWKAYSLMKTFQGLVKWFDSGNYWVTSMSGKFSVIMRWFNDASWTFHEPRKGFILELKQFARLFIYGLGIRIYCYVFKKLLYANSERLWDIEKIRSYNSSNLELSFYITFLRDSLFWQSQYDSISVLWGIDKILRTFCIWILRRLQITVFDLEISFRKFICLILTEACWK